MSCDPPGGGVGVPWVGHRGLARLFRRGVVDGELEGGRGAGPSTSPSATPSIGEARSELLVDSELVEAVKVGPKLCSVSMSGAPCPRAETRFKCLETFSVL